MNRILSITVSIIVLTSAVSAFAAPMYSAPAGFKAEPLFSTPSETLIEGFDMDSDGNAYYIETAYQWYGDPVNWYMPESSALKKRAPDGATQTLYNFSSGVWGSFVRLVGDNVWFGNSSDNVIRSISTEGGAAEAFVQCIVSAGNQFLEAPVEAPYLPNWNRVSSAVPNIFERLISTVEEDNRD